MAGNKYIANVAGTLAEIAAVQTSAGVADASKIPALDAAGRFSTTMMPVGIAADVAVLTASEALSAGDLVSVWNNTGTANARKADASAQGKEAHGFVVAAVAQGADATVYFEGTNAHVTGLTPGVQYLSTTPGGCSATAPSGSGHVVQRVGFATSPTTLNFHSAIPVLLA